MTLREYIVLWQEAYDKHQSRPTTYAAHNYVFKNHILPGLGDIPLSELTSEMVGEFLEERRGFGNHRPGSSGLGEETMRHIHRLLQQCLDQAIRDGLLTENPAKAFHYRKSMTVKANIMTPLEMEDYLDAADRLGYLPMFMLALTTGLRQGELIALKWSDLDIESRTLTIAENRAVVRRELVEYGDQTRTITLTTEVVDLLIMEHSKHPSSPLMFMHPATLKPYSPQMVRRMHNEIIKEAGLDHIRFTDLRHTCAVLSLRNGMETKELARMLGHYRPSITRQNYEPYLPRTAKKDEDMLQLLPLLRMLLHPLVCGSGSFRIHRVYPAPVGLKFFVRLGILEGHKLTAFSTFAKSLQLSTFRFYNFSLSNSRRTISPGWSFLRFGTARSPR